MLPGKGPLRKRKARRRTLQISAEYVSRGFFQLSIPRRAFPSYGRPPAAYSRQHLACLRLLRMLTLILRSSLAAAVPLNITSWSKGHSPASGPAKRNLDSSHAACCTCRALCGAALALLCCTVLAIAMSHTMLLQHHYGTHLFGDDLARGARLSVRIHHVHHRPRQRPKRYRKAVADLVTEAAKELAEMEEHLGGQVNSDTDADTGDGTAIGRRDGIGGQAGVHFLRRSARIRYCPSSSTPTRFSRGSDALGCASHVRSPALIAWLR